MATRTCSAIGIRAGERLRFLLARGNDGKVRAVFDACRQCYKFHQGYDVAHGMLICRLCGNRYPIDHMTEGEASCVPVSLPHHEGASAVEEKSQTSNRERRSFEADCSIEASDAALAAILALAVLLGGMPLTLGIVVHSTEAMFTLDICHPLQSFSHSPMVVAGIIPDSSGIARFLPECGR